MINEIITQSENLLSPVSCDCIPGLLLISLKHRVPAQAIEMVIGLDRSRHTTAVESEAAGIFKDASLSQQHTHPHVRSLLAFATWRYLWCRYDQSCSIRSRRTGADRSTMQGLFPNRSCMLIHRPYSNNNHLKSKRSWHLLLISSTKRMPAYYIYIYVPRMYLGWLAVAPRAISFSFFLAGPSVFCT